MQGSGRQLNDDRYLVLGCGYEKHRVQMNMRSSQFGFLS